MIRLTKHVKPQILFDNEVQWTAALVAKIQSGEAPSITEKTRYRHAQIKIALVHETHGKCAYCESKLLHIHHGDVEHIFPKSLAIERIFEWENLTLSCEICNQSKSDLDPLAESILDPYQSEPSEHLIFIGPLIFQRNSIVGLSTRTILKLDRSALNERRKEHLEKIMEVINTIVSDQVPLVTRKALYLNFLERYAGDSGEYAAMVRSVVAQLAPTLAEVADLG